MFLRPAQLPNRFHKLARVEAGCRLIQLSLLAWGASLLLITTRGDGLDTWLARNSGTTNDLYSVTYGNGRFIAVGGTTVVWSTSGLDWFPAVTTFPTSSANDPPSSCACLAKVTFGNGLFVLAGSTGQIWISSDGANWTYVTFGIASSSSIAYGNHTFVIGGYFGEVAYSLDGTIWNRSKRFTTPDGFIESMAFGNGKFVAGERPLRSDPLNNAHLYKSADGISWSPISKMAVTSVVYGDGMFLVNGEVISNSAYFTNDTAIASDILGVNKVINAYGGGYFINTSSANQVLSRTANGPWILHAFSPSVPPTSWTYGAGTFVGVGKGGRIVQSGRLAPHFKLPSASHTALSELKAHVPGPGTVVVEASTNLVDWLTVPFSAAEEDEQISVSLTGALRSRFYRLKMTD